MSDAQADFQRQLIAVLEASLPYMEKVPEPLFDLIAAAEEHLKPGMACTCPHSREMNRQRGAEGGWICMRHGPISRS